MIVTITTDAGESITLGLNEEQVKFLRREGAPDDTIPFMLRDIIEFWLDTNMGTWDGATVVDFTPRGEA